jgi:outer membrane receptor protein involved in Fe transport
MVFVQDRSQPVTSPATTAIDAFIGYNRKFFDGKIRWSVQLNVRNLLDDDALTLQRPYSDGSPRVFAIQQPRSFILTNTFRF